MKLAPLLTLVASTKLSVPTLVPVGAVDDTVKLSMRINEVLQLQRGSYHTIFLYIVNIIMRYTQHTATAVSLRLIKPLWFPGYATVFRSNRHLGVQFDETKSHAYSDNRTLACFGKQGALDNSHYSVIVVGS
jgi:hypothetical protein